MLKNYLKILMFELRGKELLLASLSLSFTARTNGIAILVLAHMDCCNTIRETKKTIITVIIREEAVCDRKSQSVSF